MNTLKPFNLEEALAGKPVITRNGYPIIELKYFQTIGSLAVVRKEPDEKLISYFICCDGTHNDTVNCVTDLFMAPTKKQGWVNIYKQVGNTYVATVYLSEEEALQNRCIISLVDTVMIEWEE